EIPLHWAARNGHANVVAVLANERVNVNALNKNGESSLLIASRHGHHDVVHVLLERGASSSIQDQFGDTPLHCAASLGHCRLLRLLCSSKTPPPPLLLRNQPLPFDGFYPFRTAMLPLDNQSFGPSTYSLPSLNPYMLTAWVGLQPTPAAPISKPLGRCHSEDSTTTPRAPDVPTLKAKDFEKMKKQSVDEDDEDDEESRERRQSKSSTFSHSSGDGDVDSSSGDESDDEEDVPPAQSFHGVLPGSVIAAYLADPVVNPAAQSLYTNLVSVTAASRG
ncbi:hypothetical protein GCK32_017296, partial [Trichostrongylus colubriformis]